MTNRRRFLLCLGALPLSVVGAHAQPMRPIMTVHKDPNCGCCTAWADKLTAAGFDLEVRENLAMNRLKARLGVPQRLASCHTAEIAGYVIEGHVPSAEIVRLLTERPAAKGLAVPGMPLNSPGMEVPGASDEEYDVVLFGPTGDRVFARYAGARRV
jgi:hypothetical protein